MRLPSAALVSRLEKQLDQAYLFFGSELLLVEEASDQLRQAARMKGIDEFIRLTAGIDLDWQRFSENTRSIGMFSTRRVIEIRLPTGKPGAEGSKALLSFVEQDNKDVILVLLLGQTDKRAQTAEWFNEMEKRSTVVEAKAVAPKKIPRWIEERLSSRGLRVEPGVADKLAFYVEGNLLAAAQEIEKLSLLLDNGEILTDELLEKSIFDQARFNVYQLIDSCLQGVPSRALQILTNLERNGTEPILVIWAFARETRAMLEMAMEIRNGQLMQAVLRQHRVWSTRLTFVRQALERHSEGYWRDLLARLSELDQMTKGRRVEVGSSWDQLERVVLSVCGINTESPPAF